jgi:stringent starvation protein B
MRRLQHLRFRNEEVEFDTRLEGAIYHVRFPMRAVLSIYAEIGGMIFTEHPVQ